MLAFNRDRLPVVLLLSLQKQSWCHGVYMGLLSGIREHARVMEATSESAAIPHLEDSAAHSVIVTDAAMVNGEFKNVSRKLVRYGKGGGIVVFAGLTSGLARPNNLKKYFCNEWGLAWEMGSYRREVFSVN